jgi:hypothetical protein
LRQNRQHSLLATSNQLSVLLHENNPYVRIMLTYRLNMRRIFGIDQGLESILNKAESGELDYGFVMDCLKGYKHPRVKLNHLLKIKALVRVKKGLYVPTQKFARRPFSPEVLANIIYGPSYLSLEWACQYYRLIPERVTTYTSATMQRSKQFQTPIGLFTYDHVPTASYSSGVTLITAPNGERALMATKEKALADLLVLRRGAFTSMKHFKETLFEDLRVEEEDIQNLNLVLLQEIYNTRQHSAIYYLIECVKT